MSATQATGPYRVGERIGASVWKGEDTRNGKPVALKILSKQLPKDQAKRDAFLREVRVAAALYHAFLVPISEIVPLGENLVMVMTWLEVLPISKYINRKAMERSDCLHLAYQLADGVKYLHTKSFVHGNLNGDSVMVTPDAQIKIGGFNMGNLLARGEGLANAYQQKGNDARSVAYMAPEQIMGQPVDAKADVYSASVIVYEMATGRLPYEATAAADYARKIVEGQPVSPVVVNPSIDKGILAILGRCLFKDQYRRLKDGKALLEEITRIEPDAARFANELAAKTSAAAVAPAQDAAAKQAILFIADVANYDELAKTDPEKATQAASRMQQLLGEAVYLFDGKVLDPFGTRMIAEMPSVESALEAARKGEFDFSPDQQNGEPIQVRLLLHAGPVGEKDGKVEGDGIARATQVLSQLPPLSLHMTEDFLKRGRAGVRVRDAGAKSGVKVFTITPSEPPAPKAPPEPTAAELEAEAVAEAEAEMQVIAAEAAKRRNRNIAITGGAVALLVIVGGGAALMRSRSHPQSSPAAHLTRKTTRPMQQQAAVMINPISVEGADPVLVDRANAIRLGASEILRHISGLRLVETPAQDVTPFAATLRAGATGPEMVSQQGAATPVAVPDAASGIRAILGWVAEQTHVEIRGVSQSPEALNAYADAVTATAANDAAKAEPAIKAAVTADPNFLPAQLLAMRYFSMRSDAQQAVEAAKRVMALDATNVDAARMVARTMLSLGDVQSSFAAYRVILQNDAGDVEALTHVARYAASIGDATRFNAARARLSKVPVSTIAVHDGDVLAATGRLEAAVKQYYTIEEQVANNPALSLKIGRISVLMQSVSIAEIELGKLQQSDPVYGYHLLKAYIAAHQRNAEQAEQELKAASDASTPGDDFWTSAAEVYVLLGENDKVLEALEKAVGRKEPTSSYILADPLFAYLKADERFENVRAAALAQQQDISQALAQIVI